MTPSSFAKSEVFGLLARNMVKLPTIPLSNNYNYMNLNKKNTLEHGKVFATKVVIQCSIPVDGEKTCLNTPEKVSGTVYKKPSSLYRAIPR